MDEQRRSGEAIAAFVERHLGRRRRGDDRAACVPHRVPHLRWMVSPDLDHRLETESLGQREGVGILIVDVIGPGDLLPPFRARLGRKRGIHPVEQQSRAQRIHLIRANRKNFKYRSVSIH